MLQTILLLTDFVFYVLFACFDESINLYQWIKPWKSYITVDTMQKQNMNWFRTTLIVVVYYSYTNGSHESFVEFCVIEVFKFWVI